MGHKSGGMIGFWEPSLDEALDEILHYLNWNTTFVRWEETFYNDRMKILHE